jgi:hypothetical protein
MRATGLAGPVRLAFVEDSYRRHAFAEFRGSHVGPKFTSIQCLLTIPAGMPACTGPRCRSTVTGPL